jgi:hypothetical protein
MPHLHFYFRLNLWHRAHIIGRIDPELYSRPAPPPKKITWGPSVLRCGLRTLIIKRPSLGNQSSLVTLLLISCTEAIFLV